MLQPKDTDWLNRYKNKTHIYAVYKKPTSDLKTYKLKVRGWKNIFHANRKPKKAGVAILISDKIDLKIKKITKDKEGHYIIIKGSVQEEDITIVNIYAPNIGVPQYTRKTLTDIRHKGFSCGSAGKEFTCSAGDLGLIPGLGRSPGEGKGYHSTILTWRTLWTYV